MAEMDNGQDSSAYRPMRVRELTDYEPAYYREMKYAPLEGFALWQESRSSQRKRRSNRRKKASSEFRSPPIDIEEDRRRSGVDIVIDASKAKLSTADGIDRLHEKELSLRKKINILEQIILEYRQSLEVLRSADTNTLHVISHLQTSPRATSLRDIERAKRRAETITYERNRMKVELRKAEDVQGRLREKLQNVYARRIGLMERHVISNSLEKRKKVEQKETPSEDIQDNVHEMSRAVNEAFGVSDDAFGGSDNEEEGSRSELSEEDEVPKKSPEKTQKSDKEKEEMVMKEIESSEKEIPEQGQIVEDKVSEDAPEVVENRDSVDSVKDHESVDAPEVVTDHASVNVVKDAETVVKTDQTEVPIRAESPGLLPKENTEPPSESSAAVRDTKREDVEAEKEDSQTKPVEAKPSVLDALKLQIEVKELPPLIEADANTFAEGHGHVYMPELIPLSQRRETGRRLASLPHKAFVSEMKAIFEKDDNERWEKEMYRVQRNVEQMTELGKRKEEWEAWRSRLAESEDMG